MGSLKLILSDLRYFSIAWVFCSLNIMIGTWVLYIPYVKDKLGLNDAQIGIALFCLALGILLFLPLVPYLTKKVGLGKYTLLGIVLFAVAFTGPLWAVNYTLLCASLFLVGIFSGSTDVAMNAVVSQIEKEEGINMMSSAHGFFSLGGVIGGSIGTFLMVFFSKPVYHMLVMALLVILLNLWLSKHYFNIIETRDATEEKRRSGIHKLRPLFVIAFIAFVIMSSEGAIEHWSALYLVEVVKVSSDNLAGLGFIFFSVAMTIGRFFGDGISAKIGSVKTILIGCFLACAGYLLILYKELAVAVIGFGIIGTGLSVIIPELFRMAGKAKGISASAAISFVSGMGFLGFLLGPIVLGFISNAFSLVKSFLTLLGLTVLALIISYVKLRYEKLNRS